MLGTVEDHMSALVPHGFVDGSIIMDPDERPEAEAAGAQPFFNSDGSRCPELCFKITLLNPSNYQRAHHSTPLVGSLGGTTVTISFRRSVEDRARWDVEGDFAVSSSSRLCGHNQYFGKTIAGSAVLDLALVPAHVLKERFFLWEQKQETQYRCVDNLNTDSQEARILTRLVNAEAWSSSSTYFRVTDPASLEGAADSEVLESLMEREMVERAVEAAHAWRLTEHGSENLERFNFLHRGRSVAALRADAPIKDMSLLELLDRLPADGWACRQSSATHG